ncbi:hypothetical protein AB0K60_19830 [Thermopolyspora sp. NPDC052614]|uniref:hypothetical protein n=1 Tax=Thermopolyspora sp. NPDC052614 TaxID=3155682 RepID=UPI00344A2923
MASPTSDSLLQAATEHPILAVYLSGAAVMLAVLAGVALSRPRAFAAVLEDAAVDNRLDRPLLLGAVVVAWSAAWPVTALVILARTVRRR